MVVFVAGWVLIRIAVWESPLLPDSPPEASPLPSAALAERWPGGREDALSLQERAYAERPVSRAGSLAFRAWSDSQMPGFSARRIASEPTGAASAPDHERAEQRGNTPLISLDLNRFAPVMRPLGSVETAAHHGKPASPAQPDQAALPLSDTRLIRRWSADGWVLWRHGSDAPLVAGQPSYGRSQAGALLRGDLGLPGDVLPQAYLRVTSTLEGVQEREAAIGVSARPVRAVPLRLAAEGRVSDRPDAAELRAAVVAISEIPPFDLPGGLTGETYAQAGYVTGTAATPFIDAQARVQRAIIRGETIRLEAGGGIWGGAQEGSSRLDIGPSASLRFRLGDGQGRVSAEYRFRVAGDAAPASGPALTLTAGF